MAVVAVLVRIKLGSPVLFGQKRPGYKTQLFTIYKFRTMLDARDAAGNLLPDAARLPHFGKVLRSTSLDELPELWNVLKGEMSWVGPRPLLIVPTWTATPGAKSPPRCSARGPGWAQVNGRNAITWSEKFKLDVWYWITGSFWLDIKILS